MITIFSEVRKDLTMLYTYTCDRRLLVILCLNASNGKTLSLESVHSDIVLAK